MRLFSVCLHSKNETNRKRKYPIIALAASNGTLYARGTHRETNSQSQYLHDGLAPTLAALALTTSTIEDLIEIKPLEVKRMAHELQADIRTTVGDIRRLVYDLRPPALDQLGLLAALHEHIAHGMRPASTQNALLGENVKVSMLAPSSLSAFPAAVEVATYRIVQEALTNVRRHAQARTCQITISLLERRRVLQIEVYDDGRGISEEYRAGVGLNSMQERAAELGGTCIIEAREPTGTCICVCLPL